MRRQMTLFPELKKLSECGGSLSKGKRKVRRSIALKRPMHVTMKAADNQPSFLLPQHKQFVQNQIRLLGRRFGVRIYATAVVGNQDRKSVV